MHKKQYIFILLLVFQFCGIGFGKEYYVSKAGSDANQGTRANPFLSIGKAAEEMRAGDTCWIDDGIYSETVRPRRSGLEGSPLRFRKLNENGKVVLSGVDPIDRNKWEQASPQLFKVDCKMAMGHENQVFLGEQMLLEARWPNSGKDLLEPTLAEMDDGTTKTQIVDPDLPDFDYTGAQVWVHANFYWSNWTTSVTGTPSQGRIEIIDSAPFHEPKRHVTAPGAEYFVFGARDLLDAENEWFYDGQERALYVFRKDGKLPDETYYVKSRLTALDLRDRADIQFHGIDIVGATIETDEQSLCLVFDSMSVLYPYFSSVTSGHHDQADKGVRLMGRECVIRNSEIAYSSGTGVVLFGENNQVLNCYIHDHDFIGTYASCVQLGGTGNIISHSTLTRSGRSVIDYGAMNKAIIQYCDMSHSGMLTSDLGLTYGNVIEGGNSEVRYNLLHDNEGKHFNMGLYYDHGTQNIISHHNIIYGVNFSGFHLNHYASYHLVYNNTSISDGFGFRNLWGNKYDPELNGARFVNNLFSGYAETSAPYYHWSSNVVEYTGFDPANPFRADEGLMEKGQYLEGISRVAPGQRPGIGAIESEELAFRVGHDFDNPPQVDTARSRPLHRNMIQNSAFEHEDNLSPWDSRGKVRKISHNLKIQIDEDKGLGRMGSHSIGLVAKGSEILQEISGLEPNACYRFIAFLQVDNNEAASLGVRYADGTEFLSPQVTKGSPEWRRVNLSFITPKDAEPVTVFVRRLSAGRGNVSVDDTGLVLESKM